MNFILNRRSFIGIWGLILALSIVVRCNPTLIYRASGIEYVLMILGATLAVALNLKGLINKNILLCDFFVGASTIFLFTTQDLSKFIFVTLLCITFYFLIQNSYFEIRFIKYPLILFAILTSIVTWISFFAPSFYVSKILSLFPEGSSLEYSFLNRNMYHGFTNHYSRNSYYIIVGILLLFSSVLCEKKRRKLKLLLIAFLFCTEFLVAKRGPTLFLLLTLFIVVLKKEPSFAQKVSKSFKFIAFGITLFVLAYMFVPGVNNIVNRILAPNSTADISSSRFYLWGVAWTMFKASPIIGNGWGSYLNAMSGTTFQGAHNDYLQFLAETGVVGFMVNILANISCLFYSSKVFDYFRNNKFDYTFELKWAIFSYSIQIFILLYALTGMPHYSYEQYGLYLMLCGFSVGLYKNRLSYAKKEG